LRFRKHLRATRQDEWKAKEHKIMVDHLRRGEEYTPLPYDEREELIEQSLDGDAEQAEHDIPLPPPLWAVLGSPSVCLPRSCSLAPISLSLPFFPPLPLSVLARPAGR
jgi:hypothetical protein